MSKKVVREVKRHIKELEKQAKALENEEGEVLPSNRAEYAALIQALADDREFLKIVLEQMNAEKRG